MYPENRFSTVDDVDHEQKDSRPAEGPLAKSIEQQTAKIPSDVYLWAALGSMGASAALQISGAKHGANFVGLWAPCFLMLGLYNKMVKLLGSEARA